MAVTYWYCGHRYETPQDDSELQRQHDQAVIRLWRHRTAVLPAALCVHDTALFNADLFYLSIESKINII